MSAWPSKVFIYTDGASRGNPGPCSLGVYIIDSENHLVHEEGLYLEDSNTNNFAEYKAVIHALKLTIENNVEEVHLFSDSQLLIRQLNGEYRVKSSNIKPLFETCKDLIKKLPSSTFKHIKREKNTEADALANQALDSQKFL